CSPRVARHCCSSALLHSDPSLLPRPPPACPLFPYTTLFRSSLPGVGRFALEGINLRDYPVVQGAVLLIAAAFVLVNLLVDVLYRSEEHTSALQSRENLVCRLLLEIKHCP